MEQDINRLAETLGQLCIAKSLSLVTAESCTGGGVGYAITSISGSSNWFDRGFITYSNSAKMEMINVSQDTLSNDGAVSEAVAREMAIGALEKSRANVSLAITGIAGPTGGTQNKPVGTCCFAWASDFFATTSKSKLFFGNRHDIRVQAISFVLSELITLVEAIAEGP